MKNKYDFTNAEVGKYYRPLEELEIPIYLNAQVQQGLAELAQAQGKEINQVANELLKHDLEQLRKFVK